MVEEQQKELEEEDSSAVQDEVSIIELRQRKAGIKSAFTKARRFFTTYRVTGNMNIIDWNVCSQEWSHLKFHNLESRPIVDILIGLDHVHLHYSIKDIKGKPDQPIARLTPLGWMRMGALGDKIGPTTHFATIYFTLDQTIRENIDVVLRKFWEIDSSSMEVYLC